jgi:2-C-methyl-D-erythritol 4-phosphate cytidylyltransferase
VVAVVPAAGAGVRLGGARPKQFLEIGGESILGRTLRRLATAPSVDALVVAASAAEIALVSDMVDGLELPGCVVEGGEERFHSVLRGLEAVPDCAEVVLVHDGVRPFVTEREIEQCVEGARRSGAAIAATAPVETVKEIEEDRVTATLDRRRIRLAQTPQAFRLDLFRRAYAAALEQGYTGTDEASLVERLGERIVIVEADRNNRKITTAVDLALAECLASGGEYR